MVMGTMVVCAAAENVLIYCYDRSDSIFAVVVNFLPPSAFYSLSSPGIIIFSIEATRDLQPFVLLITRDRTATSDASPQKEVRPKCYYLMSKIHTHTVASRTYTTSSK